MHSQFSLSVVARLQFSLKPNSCRYDRDQEMDSDGSESHPKPFMYLVDNYIALYPPRLWIGRGAVLGRIGPSSTLRGHCQEETAFGGSK